MVSFYLHRSLFGINRTKLQDVPCVLVNVFHVRLVMTSCNEMYEESRGCYPLKAVYLSDY